jgi:translation initiation factor 1
MAKKKNKGDGIVYSTNPQYKPFEFLKAEESPASDSPATGTPLKIFLDRLGGNRMVSRITGFNLPLQKLEELEKNLKKKCGVGGSSREGEILIQGNHREKLKKLLEEMGYRVKLAGG